MKRVPRLAAALLAGAAVACGDSASAPAGTGGPSRSFALVLEMPDNHTGALLLSISGGTVDSVVAAGDAAVSAVTADGETQVVITGTLPNGGVVARLYAPDGDAAQYRVVVQQAADAVTFERRAPSSYGVTVTP